MFYVGFLRFFQGVRKSYCKVSVMRPDGGKLVRNSQTSKCNSSNARKKENNLPEKPFLLVAADGERETSPGSPTV